MNNTATINTIPIWEKVLLTPRETSAYSNIGINKIEEDLFFCEIIYNYSKIEFYSDYDNLPVILANALIIQKSIKYNDTLISLELESNTNDGREVKYELEAPKETESTFSQYLQEYVAKEEVEVVLPDED